MGFVKLTLKLSHFLDQNSIVFDSWLKALVFFLLDLYIFLSSDLAFIVDAPCLAGLNESSLPLMEKAFAGFGRSKFP